MEATEPVGTIEGLLREGAWVRALARSLVRDPEHADDAVQETWRRVLERPPEHVANARAWLRVALKNALLQTRRSERRRRRVEEQAACAEATPSTGELAQRAALQREVVGEVLALAEPYRSAVLLRWFEELPPRVIAARLGVPVDTVRTRLQRAHARLRARLDARYGARASWCQPLAPLVSGAPVAPGSFIAIPLGIGSLVSTNAELVVVGAALVACLFRWRAHIQVAELPLDVSRPETEPAIRSARREGAALVAPPKPPAPEPAAAAPAAPPPRVAPPTSTRPAPAAPAPAAAPAHWDASLDAPLPNPATSGAVRLRVRWLGPRPELPPLDVSPDKARGCCAYPEEVDATDRRLVIGDDAGVADVVIELEPRRSFSAAARVDEPFVLDQRGCRFEPRVLVVPRSATVRYRNSDAIAPNVHTISRENAPFNANVSAGAWRDEQVEHSETIVVTCDVHPWMEAFVCVTDAAFFGKSDAAGIALVDGVAPGHYRVEWRHMDLGGNRLDNVEVIAGEVVELELELSERDWKRRRRGRRR